MSDPFRQSLQDADGKFAEPWQPKEGEVLIGHVRRYERGNTRYGPADICVVEPEGDGFQEEVGVWLLHFGLKRKFASLRPRIGERLGIKYVGMERPEDGDPYAVYVVQVDRGGDTDAGVPRFVDEETPQPAPQAAPPPQPAPPPSPGPHDAPGGHHGAPAPPSAPREDPAAELSRQWKVQLQKLRVEPWGEEALARTKPSLRDEPHFWDASDYHNALATVRQRGPSIFLEAAQHLAKSEPVDPELEAKVRELIEGGELDTKLRFRVQEALETGWHDAVSWALELVETIQARPKEPAPPEPEPRPAKEEQDLAEPEDDLPF